MPYAWLLLGKISHRAGEFAKAEQDLQAALALACENGDSYLEGYIRWAVGHLRLDQGHRAEALRLLHQARHLLEKAPAADLADLDRLIG